MRETGGHIDRLRETGGHIGRLEEIGGQREAERDRRADRPP